MVNGEDSVDRLTEIILELNAISVEYDVRIADKVAEGVDEGYLVTIEDLWEAAEMLHNSTSSTNLVEKTEDFSLTSTVKPFEVVLNVEGEEINSEGFFSTREEARAKIEELRKALTTTIYFGGWEIVER